MRDTLFILNIASSVVVVIVLIVSHVRLQRRRHAMSIEIARAESAMKNYDAYQQRLEKVRSELEAIIVAQRNRSNELLDDVRCRHRELAVQRLAADNMSNALHRVLVPVLDLLVCPQDHPSNFPCPTCDAKADAAKVVAAFEAYEKAEQAKAAKLVQLAAPPAEAEQTMQPLRP